MFFVVVAGGGGCGGGGDAADDAGVEGGVAVCDAVDVAVAGVYTRARGRSYSLVVTGTYL